MSVLTLSLWPNEFWDGLQLVCSIGLGLIAFADDIANSNPRLFKPFKNILTKILTVVVLGVLIFIANNGKDDNAKAKEKSQRESAIAERDSINNIVKHERDSINLVNLHLIDSLTHNQIDSANKGLEKVGIRIDTSAKSYGKLIQMVRDSARKTVMVRSTPKPEVYIDTILVTNHQAFATKRFTFKVISSKAEASDFQAKLYAVAILDGEYVRLNGGLDISLDQLTTAKFYTYSFDVYHTDNIKYEKYFFYLPGSYTDNETHKLYPFTYLAVVDSKTMQVRFPSGDGKIAMLGIFKKFYGDVNDKALR